MLSIQNLTRGKLPRVPFARIAEEVLGKNYDLSVVIVGNKDSRRLNRTFRKKNKPANVLSFSLEKSAGEIFLNPTLAKTQAKDFDMSEGKFLIFLFIHGLLHLKGARHGSRMEALEKRLLRRLSMKRS